MSRFGVGIGCLWVVAGCGGGGGQAADASGEPPVIDGGLVAVDASGGVDAHPLDCTPVSGTQFTVRQVASGLEVPVLLTAPTGDARLFVVEKPGRIRVIKGGALLPTPFLDISSRVTEFDEEAGLLGMAFHPDYASTGKFYVSYTAEGPRRNMIAEYTVSAGDSDVADPAEREVIAIPQPHTNHNGGMIAFGPDGYLYIGVGDGGGSDDPDGNGQNRTTMLAKLLRIDVAGTTYSIPATNPFVGEGNGVREEIWAYGLRNPWRFSFDRATGDLYLGDVGQGAREEIDVQLAGAGGGQNYGWDIYEGTECRPSEGSCDLEQVPPVYEYGRGDTPCSVIGGYVYRGACLPDLQGRYFFGDFCGRWTWSFSYSGSGSVSAVDEHTELNPGERISMTSFGEDGFGELYVLFGDGGVYRMVAP